MVLVVVMAVIMIVVVVVGMVVVMIVAVVVAFVLVRWNSVMRKAAHRSGVSTAPRRPQRGQGGRGRVRMAVGMHVAGGLVELRDCRGRESVRSHRGRDRVGCSKDETQFLVHPGPIQ